MPMLNELMVPNGQVEAVWGNVLDITGRARLGTHWGQMVAGVACIQPCQVPATSDPSVPPSLHSSLGQNVCGLKSFPHLSPISSSAK